MRRREFVLALGGAAMWPLGTHAQQAERMRRVGMIMPFNEGDTEAQARKTLFEQSLQQLGWTIGLESADRYSLSRWRSRPASPIRYGTGCAYAGRNRDFWQRNGCTGATGDPNHPNRDDKCCRSGRRGLRPKLVAAGRKCHRLHQFRIQHEWKMGGIAQANFAEHDARGGPPQSYLSGGHRPIRRYPIRGAVAWS